MNKLILVTMVGLGIACGCSQKPDPRVAVLEARVTALEVELKRVTSKADTEMAAAVKTILMQQEAINGLDLVLKKKVRADLDMWTAAEEQLNKLPKTVNRR